MDNRKGGDVSRSTYEYRNERGNYVAPTTRRARVIIEPDEEQDGSNSHQSSQSGNNRQEDGGNRNRRVMDAVVLVNEERQQTYWTRLERMKFVRYVYAILSVMLLVDAIFIVLALFVEPLNDFLLGVPGLVLYIVALLVFIITYLVLVCVRSCRLRSPQNYIMLTIMTLSMGVMLAAMAAHHSVLEILYGAVGTLLVTILVTMIALCGTFDITGYGIYLCIASVVLVVGGLIIMVVCLVGLCGDSWKIIWLVLSILFVLLFSMYLLYDTQMVIGGGRIQLSSNEYILGAIHLWIDIVQIFMCVTGIASLTSS